MRQVSRYNGHILNKCVEWQLNDSNIHTVQLQHAHYDVMLTFERIALFLSMEAGIPILCYVD